MKGKEHMMIGTTATATMGIGFLMNNNIGDVVHLVPLIAGGFIGSYMPDIDSRKSKASQVFNKIIMILMVALVMGYSFFIFGNFIIRRVECYFLIIGIILIYVSVERIKKR